MPHRKLLAQLASARNELADLELSVRDQLESARERRDRLILRAIEVKVPERLISHAAGVSRGWIHKLKKGGMP